MADRSADFEPTVAVEALACTVGLSVAQTGGSRHLFRLAPWQAQEAASELGGWADGRVPGQAGARCGWRTADGDLLVIVAVSVGGAHFIASFDGGRERFELAGDELQLIADDLHDACQLVADLTEQQLVQAAMGGWA